MNNKIVAFRIGAVLALLSLLGFVSSVSAKGPTNVVMAPYNPNAWWHSGQYIGPEAIGVGTTTIIVLEDVTIVVDAIPSATYDPVTDKWEGTWLMWKARYGSTLDKSWSTYKFWLNGAGPVAITYTYTDGTVITEEATEFIFFKWDWGTGEITLQAYK